MIVSVVLGWIMSCVQNVSQIFFLIFMPFTLLQYTLTIFLCFSTLIYITCTIIPHIQSHSVHHKPHILWSKASLADTDQYCHMGSSTIPELPPEVFTCVVPNCTEHIDTLDSFAKKFVFSLLDCACKCIPHSKTSSRTLVGWNDTSCNRLKQTANFWHKIWEDAGDPSSGVLFQIKRYTKTRYKYEVRRLKRRQNVLLQDKFASLFANKKKNAFCSQIRQLNHTRSSGLPSSVDSVSGDKMIANLNLLMSSTTTLHPLKNLFTPHFKPQLKLVI